MSRTRSLGRRTGWDLTPAKARVTLGPSSGASPCRICGRRDTGMAVGVGGTLQLRQYCEHPPMPPLVRGKCKFGQNGADMRFHRALAEVELIGDASVGLALGHELKDVPFA